MFGKKKPRTREKFSLYEEEMNENEETMETPIRETIKVKPVPQKRIDPDIFIYLLTKQCCGSLEGLHKHDDEKESINIFRKLDNFTVEESMVMLHYRLNKSLYDSFEKEFLIQGNFRFLSHLLKNTSNEEKIISVIEIMDIIFYHFLSVGYKILDETKIYNASYKSIYEEFRKNHMMSYHPHSLDVIMDDLMIVMGDSNRYDITLLNMIHSYMILTQEFFIDYKKGVLEDNTYLNEIARYFL